jgi:hypothetical protein
VVGDADSAVAGGGEDDVAFAVGLEDASVRVMGAAVQFGDEAALVDAALPAAAAAERRPRAAGPRSAPPSQAGTVCTL